MSIYLLFLGLFFFHASATSVIYTLSLHDALPICLREDWAGWPEPRLMLSPRRPPSGVGGRRGLSISRGDRKSTRLNSSHVAISYAVFCLKKKTNYRL